MENPYTRNPLRATLWDISAGKPTKTFVFLGSVPKSVAAAARRAPRTATDEAALRKFYGRGWRALLGGGAAPTTGGGPPDFGDLGDFDTPVADFGEAPLVNELEGPPPARGPGGPLDPRPAFSDLGAYPEDSFEDAKAKIYAATGIAPYRQHLFYGERGAARTTYRVVVGSAVVATNIRALAGPADPRTSVAGVEVDRALARRKNKLQVWDFEDTRTLETRPGAYLREVFVADLEAFIEPRRRALAAALEDGLLADLVYYGAVVKYWPAADPRAFRLAVTAPLTVAAEYPLLEPPLPALRARLRLGQALSDRAYADAPRPPPPAALTEATVRVTTPDESLEVDLRAVFDLFAASPAVPAAALALGGAVVAKRHVSAAAPDVAAAVDKFFLRPPGRPALSFLVVERRPGRAPRRVRVTLHPRGAYDLSAQWREDDGVDLRRAHESLSKTVAALLAEINSFGTAAFPRGHRGPGPLLTPAAARRAGARRVQFASLTAAAAWPHALTTDGFRALKARWRAYEDAGFAGIRSLQQAGAYSFYFRRGVGAGEAGHAGGGGDAGGGNDAPQNTYARYADRESADAWRAARPGRLVRVAHRMTDLRLEVARATPEEFAIILRYFFSFLGGLRAGPDRLAPGLLLRPGQARPSGRRLQSLQELDPELYDLKKHDPRATVYSVLCQGDRQPEVVAAPGLAPPAAQKTLVPYWNFTRGEPAFYRCPSARFPHLSFRAGEHPLGYCLPCCKKSRPPPATRATLVNADCLANRRPSPGGEGGPELSRHVLNYGKVVAPGRAARPPEVLENRLLYGAAPDDAVFRLIGVRQAAAQVPDAGAFFALAAALDREPAAVAADLAETALLLGDSYFTLAGGRAAAFGSAAALAAQLAAAFGGGDSVGGFSEFAPGGAAHAFWAEVVTDLARIRYDVEVVAFEVPGEGETATLAAPAAAAARVRGGDVDVVVLVAGAAGTYPLALMDEREFLRVPHGRGPARRFFSAARRKGEARDGVVAVLRDLLVTLTEERLRPPDAGVVAAMAAASGGKYAVETRLANLRGECYGLVLAARGGGAVYAPVPYSPLVFGGPGDVLYGPRPAGRYPAAALRAFVADLDAYVAAHKKTLAHIYLPTTPRTALALGGKVIGFETEKGLRFFHDPEAPETDATAWGVPLRALAYDPREVDAAIFEAGRPAREGLPRAKRALRARALRANYLYQMFLAEFVNAIQNERDGGLRRKVLAEVGRARFSDPSAFAGMLKRVKALLKNHADDIPLFRAIVATAFVRSGPDEMKKDIVTMVENTQFQFDKTTLAAVRRAPEGAARKLLGDFVAAFVGAPLGNQPLGDQPLGAPPEGDQPEGDQPEGMPNVVAAGKAKLRLAAPKLAEFLDILLSDIRSDKVSLQTARASFVIDPLSFARHPGERIDFIAR